MQFLVAAVGKPRDANLAGAIAEYEIRAARYWPLRVHEVREEPARSSSPARARCATSVSTSSSPRTRGASSARRIWPLMYSPQRWLLPMGFCQYASTLLDSSS